VVGAGQWAGPCIASSGEHQRGLSTELFGKQARPWVEHISEGRPDLFAARTAEEDSETWVVVDLQLSQRNR
jgi:hypothetical protein